MTLSFPVHVASGTIGEMARASHWAFATASDGPRLLLVTPTEEGELAGAFSAAAPGALSRASGGPAVLAGPASLHVMLSLPREDTWLACPPDAILNRHVRPLLRALSRLGSPASYFGRDWISVRHRPVALLAFAHDAASRRTLFEAFVAIADPFARDARSSFMNKKSATLEEVLGKKVDKKALTEHVARAYGEAAGASVQRSDAPLTDLLGDWQVAPPRARAAAWAETVAAPIGVVGMADCDGGVRLGGDFMLSSDVAAAIEGKLAPQAGAAELEALVLDLLTATDAALYGFRSKEEFAQLVVQLHAKLNRKTAP